MARGDFVPRASRAPQSVITSQVITSSTSRRINEKRPGVVLKYPVRVARLRVQEAQPDVPVVIPRPHEDIASARIAVEVEEGFAHVGQDSAANPRRQPCMASPENAGERPHSFLPILAFSRAANPGLDASALKLKMTESATLRDLRVVDKMLRACREPGVRIPMDNWVAAHALPAAHGDRVLCQLGIRNRGRKIPQFCRGRSSIGVNPCIVKRKYVPYCNAGRP